MRLEGKVALITGGGSGLGREAGFLFAEHGAKVVLVDRVEARVEKVRAELAERGHDGLALVADVGKEAEIAAAVDAAVDAYGGLDIMFANAGHQTTSLGTTHIWEVTDEEWQDIVSSNLTGVIWSVKHATRVMRQARRGGTIIMTGSAAAVRAFPTATLYSATKGGVNGLTPVLARELGPYGIRVNTINPLQGMSPNFMMEDREAPVVGMSYEEFAGEGWNGAQGAAALNVGTPPTLRGNAYAALFLASDESAQMSGQSFSPNDGGILNNVAMVFSDDWVDDLVTPS